MARRLFSPESLVAALSESRLIFVAILVAPAVAGKNINEKLITIEDINIYYLYLLYYSIRSRVIMNPTTIMTANHATPPTLETKIKRWVELDNKIKINSEEVRDIRTEKSVIHDEILEIVEQKQLSKATVNISDGRLKFVSTKHTAPLTLTYIEKCLSELITNGKQVEQIMSYIKKNRETKTTMEIKRVYNTKPGSGVGPGAESSDSADE